MIFVVSEKAFDKNATKWLKRRDYIIVDGSDDGTIDDAHKTGIAKKYNNVTINGGFTPHHRLTDAVKKDNKNGGDKLSWKTQNLMEDFMGSNELIASIMAVIKGFTVEIKPGDEQRNIFVVLPNRVYRTIGDHIVNRFYELTKAEFQFVYPEGDLLDKKKLLTKDLKQKDMDYLKDRILKVVKKYKLDKE